MANRRWTHEDRATIVRMWRDGAKLREIASELGVPIGHVATQMAQMRSMGVDLPSRRNTDLDVDALNNL